MISAIMEDIQQSFDAMEWHDSILVNLNIDRVSPGKRDEVVLVVEWLDARQQKVCFTDCYALEIQMNFGVVALESIREAHCITASPRLTEIRERWAMLGVELQSLCCFEIMTNSTESQICIYAIRYEISDAHNGSGIDPMQVK